MLHPSKLSGSYLNIPGYVRGKRPPQSNSHVTFSRSVCAVVKRNEVQLLRCALSLCCNVIRRNSRPCSRFQVKERAAVIRSERDIFLSGGLVGLQMLCDL